jgi:hypothetical protein
MENFYDGMGNSKTAYVQGLLLKINDLEKQKENLEKELSQVQKENLKVKKNTNPNAK